MSTINFHVFSILILSVVLISCSSDGDADNSLDGSGQTEDQSTIEYITSDYLNPLVKYNIADPSVIRAEDGLFYAYTTDAKVFCSEDMVNWTAISGAFTGSQFPNWLDGGGVWAPDINCIEGKYYLYYSLSKWGEGTKNGVGLAISTTPEGPFTDLGALFTSEEIGVDNSIDPCYYFHEGKHYIAWGSWGGIWLAELTSDALRVNTNVPIRQLAGTAFEGSMLYEHDGYFYLFCSIGACCAGMESTYEVVVCRSENFFGPYVDKEGKPMLENNYEVILTRNDKFIGPGHHSELVTDDEGKTWILYHAYDADHMFAQRCLMIDQVKWDSDGWPYMDGPSTKLQKGPVFIKK